MNRYLHGRFKLQNRLTFSFIVLAIVTSAVLTILLFLIARYQLRQEIRTRLQGMLTIAALQIDTDAMATLTDPAHMGTETYTRLRNVQIAIQATSPDIAYLYTMRRNQNGEIYFVVDAEGEELSSLGDVYTDPSPTLETNFDTMNAPLIEPDIYTDEFGSWLSGYMPLYTSDGRRDVILGMDLTANSIFVKERQYLLFSLLGFSISVIVAGLAGSLLGRNLARPILMLTEATRKLSDGDLNFQVSLDTGDESQELAEAIVLMADRQRQAVETLELRIKERTAEVEQRSRFIQAAAEVGRAAASILDADQLIADVVEKIRQSFDLYYVGLFVVDDTNTWAVLRAGTGEAGQKMLARGHRRKVGEGMIGWSVANNQSRVAAEVRVDLQRLSASELPETRSEAALPLRSRGQVIGALTVQSKEINAFDAQTVAVLQTMADQVATALDNARLFEESRASLEALERVNVDLNTRAWIDLLHQRSQISYRADEFGVEAASAAAVSSKQKQTQLGTHPDPQAVEAQNAGIAEQDQPELAPAESLVIPIQARGVILGNIEAQKPSGSLPWNVEEKALLLNLVEQLSIALDNARLYSSTQQSAARERMISEITAKVRSSTNVNKIMQTAIQELAQALHLPTISIQLRPASSASPGSVEAGESVPNPASPAAEASSASERAG